MIEVTYRYGVYEVRDSDKHVWTDLSDAWTERTEVETRAILAGLDVPTDAVGELVDRAREHGKATYTTSAPRDRTVTVGELVDYINERHNDAVSAREQQATSNIHDLTRRYYRGYLDALGELAVWLTRDPS